MDLYCWLRVLPLHVPALCEYREDIPLHGWHHVCQYACPPQGRDIQLTNETLDALGAYDWPGNVGELVNALEYAMVHVDGTTILARHLPPEIQEAGHRVADSRAVYA